MLDVYKRQPKVCLAGVSHISGIEIVGVANIKEAIDAVR